MDDHFQDFQSEEPKFSNLQIDELSLPRLALLEYTGLEKNLLKANIIWVVVFFSILIIVELFLQFVIQIEWLNPNGYFILLGLFVVLSLSLAYTYFAFFKMSYAIREKDIIYNSGLFWRSSIAIPFNRVQHCEVSIGPIDRMFGLAELKIFTAGGASSDLKIEGLTPDTSKRLKDFIITKTGIDEEE